MTHTISRRQALLALLATATVPAVTGCGGDNSQIAVLPDQGKISVPVRRSGDRKPQKGMDRDGS